MNGLLRKKYDLSKKMASLKELLFNTMDENGSRYSDPILHPRWEEYFESLKKFNEYLPTGERRMAVMIITWKRHVDGRGTFTSYRPEYVTESQDPKQRMQELAQSKHKELHHYISIE